MAAPTYTAVYAGIAANSGDLVALDPIPHTVVGPIEQETVTAVSGAMTYQGRRTFEFFWKAKKLSVWYAEINAYFPNNEANIDFSWSARDEKTGVWHSYVGKLKQPEWNKEVARKLGRVEDAKWILTVTQVLE